MTDTDPRPVVVGVDGSEGSRAAQSWAVTEATDGGCPLHLLCAWQFETAEPMAPLLPSFEDECRAIVEAASADAKTASPQIKVRGSVVHSQPAAALIEASRDAELVVVGSRGLGEVKQLLVGSISMQVAAHALCPVVVVRAVAEQPRPPGRIVVGVDGSPLSVEATGFAFERAARRGLGLTVLHAWDPTFYNSGVALTALTEAWDDLEFEQKTATAAAIAEWAEKYPDVDVQLHVTSGRPADLLVDASENAALVVVGSRGRGGFTGLLLGSVSRNVLNRALCPVAVVRPSDRAGMGDAR